MALWKPFRGSRASLNSQSKHDGYAYFCVDDGTFHIDYIDAEGNLQRKQINESYINLLLNIDNQVQAIQNKLNENITTLTDSATGATYELSVVNGKLTLTEQEK